MKITDRYVLKRVPISSSAAFGGVSTFVTVILGAVVNHEPIYGYHIIGFSLILIRIIGVIAVDRESSRL